MGLQYLIILALLTVIIVLIIVVLLLLSRNNGLKQKEFMKIEGKVDENISYVNAALGSSITQLSTRISEIQKEVVRVGTMEKDMDFIKKMLTNVKNRGIIGEIQLSNIIKDILPSNQYFENIATVPGSSNRVEFAIKLPGRDTNVLVPIDAKFPGDTYLSYLKSLEDDKENKIQNGIALDRVVIKSAKEIREKYIKPPFTTSFAIMFLPFEGLYIHTIDRGLLEKTYKEYGVLLTGPSTLSAIINSFNVGFHTLAVEEKTQEVLRLLQEISAEFTKYEDIIITIQSRFHQIDSEFEKLIGARTRTINKLLKKVTDIDE